MARDLTVEVRVFADLDALSREAARAIAERIVTRVSWNGVFAVSLAGGRTPIALYGHLAESHGTAIPWKRVHFFWSDERYVPPDDPASNFRVAREELLGRVPVPATNIHPMPTGAREPGDAAAAYESILREHFVPRGPVFDLSLLGLGVDGHTASLFPGSPGLDERRRWVMSVDAPATPVPAAGTAGRAAGAPAPAPAEPASAAPAQRLTLTLPVLNRSREIFFLVAGAEKAPALARALRARVSPTDCPAAGVRPASGRIIWWVDAAAASQLGTRTSPP